MPTSLGSSLMCQPPFFMPPVTPSVCSAPHPALRSGVRGGWLWRNQRPNPSNGNGHHAVPPPPSCPLAGGRRQLRKVP
ncbi:hypothetical protein ACP70R_040190 [Stipagrostis hirtigluma subsp. patula]